MFIVVWESPNKLYYRIVKGTYSKYYIGMENQYSHKVVLVIDLWKDIDIRVRKKVSIKSILIKYLKTCLEKLERR